MIRSFKEWESKRWAYGAARRAAVTWHTRTRKPVFFLHIGKTGGTALGRAFRQLNRTQTEYYFIALPHSVDLGQIPVGAFYFFAVRDPLERFISGFNSRKRHGAPGGRSPWTAAERQAFSVFPDAHSLALSLNPDHGSFEDALSAVQAIPHLYTMQYQYFSGEGDFLRHRPPISVVESRRLFESFNALLTKLGVESTVRITPSEQTNWSGNSTVDAVRNFSPSAIETIKNVYFLDYLHVASCLRFGSSHAG